jgi:hypothetical protein
MFWNSFNTSAVDVIVCVQHLLLVVALCFSSAVDLGLRFDDVL